MASAVKPKRNLIKQPNGGALLTPYKKGESGNPAGGKKSEITKIREEFQIKYDWEISKNDAQVLLQMLVFAPIHELQKLAENKDLPAVVVNYIHAIFKDIKKGEINTAKDIIERNFGKATQKLEIEDKTPTHIDLATLTQDQLLITCQHLLPMFEMETLESFCEWLEGFIEKKRAGEARIINQN